MDLQEFIDNQMKIDRKERMRNSPQLTLGELISEIEREGLYNERNKEIKTIRFDFGTAIPTTLDSWRGSYAELALGYKLTGYDSIIRGVDEINAENLLSELKSAIGKEFTGWKGGEFRMDESTPVWVANPGDSGNTGIIGVLNIGYSLVILTAYCEY